jgi:hypothetical protein
MPFKFNAARRHRIPLARYRVRNWPQYEAGLKRRGDPTLWIDHLKPAQPEVLRASAAYVSHGPVHLVIDSTELKLFGQGEWNEEKHGRTRRSWRKLHLALDADTGELVARVPAATKASSILACVPARSQLSKEKSQSPLRRSIG